MTAPTDLRRLMVDAVPAALLAVAVSIVMAIRIDELDGKYGVLIVAGVIGIGLSSLLLRQPVAEVTAPVVTADAKATFAPPVMPPRAPTPPSPPVKGSRIAGFEAFSLPKQGATDEENEDSFSIDAASGTIAISDGASSSFGARVWSRALVDVAAVSVVPLSASFVDGLMGPAATRWRQHHEGGELAWWAQEGLRRGGFATLLVVRIGQASQGRAWQAIAVGDSCVFHARKSGAGWQLLRAFPLESAEAFGSHPMLLSSVSPAPSDGVELAGGRLAPGDVLLAATDAVSEWLLADDRRLSFAVEAPIAEVAEAVREARTTQVMVNDDATFIRFVEGR